MEIYESIRKYKENEGLSQRDVSKKLGLSRNTVKKYWNGEKVPWNRKDGSGRNNTIITADVRQFIEDCFKQDEDLKMKKQSHTAKGYTPGLKPKKDFPTANQRCAASLLKLKQARKSFHTAAVCACRSNTG